MRPGNSDTADSGGEPGDTDSEGTETGDTATGLDNTVVPTPVDLRAALVSGDNVIAINGQDTAGGCRWAIVSGSITTE